jgi:PAS domain S-box-containing protein
MEDGITRQLEVEIPVGGQLRVFFSTKAAHRDVEGQVVGLIGISRDITERREAERALGESEERLARVVESALDAIVTMDEHRVIKLFNVAAEDIFRCSADRAIGRSFDEFASAEFRQMVILSQKAFARGGAKKRYIWAPEGLTGVRADGEEFPVEATFSQAQAGGANLYTVILRDVNERHRAKEEMRKLQLENVYLREEIGAGTELGEIVSASGAMAKVVQSAQQVAPTDSTVLILGETGTGKELIAQAIHAASPRKDRMLLKVNCAALPGGLIESDLFGHEKGAFTGALSQKLGRFQVADGGTIFLDEIGDLPLELQAKLLRVLQEGEFERVGGTSTFKVDVRVIAATNQDLETAVEEQRFRADLYYRLNVFPIRIPPLRERPEDIPLLIRHFALRYSAKMGKKIDQIPKVSMAALMGYDWPGNVRELQNVIERAAILSRGSELELGEWRDVSTGTADEPRHMTLADNERQHISRILKFTNGQVSGEKGAAQILGLKPTTLESRMKRLGITRDI